MAIKKPNLGVLSHTQELYVKFWTQFNKVCENDENFKSEFKIHPYANLRSYQDYFVDSKCYHLNSKINFKRQECRIGVYFFDVNEWHRYFANKDIIECHLGRTLEWDVKTTKGYAYWVETMPFDEKDGWDGVIKYLMSKMIIMKKEFAKYL